MHVLAFTSLIDLEPLTASSHLGLSADHPDTGCMTRRLTLSSLPKPILADTYRAIQRTQGVNTNLDLGYSSTSSARLTQALKKSTQNLDITSTLEAMANPAMLTRAVRRPLSRWALTSISSSQPKRGAAVLAGLQSTPMDDGSHGQQQLVHNPFASHYHPVATPMLWRDEFWRRVPVFKDVSAGEFISYRWSVSPLDDLSLFIPSCPVAPTNVVPDQKHCGDQRQALRISQSCCS